VEKQSHLFEFRITGDHNPIFISTKCKFFTVHKETVEPFRVHAQKFWDYLLDEIITETLVGPIMLTKITKTQHVFVRHTRTVIKKGVECNRILSGFDAELWRKKITVRGLRIIGKKNHN
jgi:hypothetical protein